jgi:hypothetical protein
MRRPRITEGAAFRDFLIAEAVEVADLALEAIEREDSNCELKMPVLVNALHFMQEVEIGHAAEVDHGQLDVDTFDDQGIIEFGESNKKRGDLINYIWGEFKKGNVSLIESVCQLELEHAEKYGISDFGSDLCNYVGEPGARSYALEALATLNVPDTLPENM